MYVELPSNEDPYDLGSKYRCMPDIQKDYRVTILFEKQQDISEEVFEIYEKQIREDFLEQVFTQNYCPYEEGMTCYI